MYFSRISKGDKDKEDLDENMEEDVEITTINPSDGKQTDTRENGETKIVFPDDNGLKFQLKKKSKYKAYSG